MDVFNTKSKSPLIVIRILRLQKVIASLRLCFYPDQPLLRLT